MTKYKEFCYSIIEQLSYDTPYIRCMNCFASEDSGGMCEGDPSNIYCGSWGHDIDRPVCKDFQSYKLSKIDLDTDISYIYRQVCDLLNGLLKENERLKKSVKRQQGSNDECAKLIEKQQKENEQLKKEVNDLKQALIRCAFEK